MFKREGGRAVKKRRKSILMPRLLRFTFCFLLFVAQLAPSLPFSFAALSRPGTARFRLPILPTARPFCFFAFVFLFVPLSLHQNRVSGAKSAPFTFEYSRSRGFLRACGISKLKILIFVFLPEGFWFTFGKGGGAG